MKKLTIYCLQAILCSIMIYACKKTDTKPATEPSDFNKPNNGCLLNEAASIQSNYDLLFTYNAKDNPATFAGLPISYDDKNRLVKIQYSARTYREWEYKDNTFLPAQSKVFTGNALVETDIFTYTNAGLLTKYDNIYANQYSAGEFIWQLSYDAKGNVTTINQPGATAPVFQATAYDDKPNFTNANQWVKYILLPSEAGYFNFPYLLFSANNATKWLLNDTRNGFINPGIESYYQYNHKGFATKDSTIFHDPVNGDFTAVQTNSFTCQ